MKDIEINSAIKIIYKGLVISKEKGRAVKDYDVFIGKKKGEEKPKSETKGKPKPKDEEKLEAAKVQAAMIQYEANEETATKLVKSGAPVKGFE